MPSKMNPPMKQKKRSGEVCADREEKHRLRILHKRIIGDITDNESGQNDCRCNQKMPVMCNIRFKLITLSNTFYQKTGRYLLFVAPFVPKS